MSACPECPHCAEAAAAKAEADSTAFAKAMIGSVRTQLRPWEFVGYGSKITAIVDWHDGWWVGIHADTNGGEVPPQIIDKRQWVSGFTEGWNDAARNREWRAEHAEANV